MLRHPAAASPLQEFTSGRFLTVIPDREAVDATRVLVATGKIVHELRAERKKRGDTHTAIFALEQLYPFPEKELVAALNQHPAAGRWCGCRKSPPTWARCLSSCHACGGWRSRARCAR